MATPTDSPTGRNLAATRAVRLGLGHTRDVSMIEGEVEVLEIDALPQERGDLVRRAHRLRPACAGHAVPLVPHLPAPHLGLARGERDARPRADARRPLVGLTPRPGAPRGRGPETQRAEAAWMPWVLAPSATPASVSRTGVAPPGPTPPIR